MNGKELLNKQKDSIRVCTLIDAWEPVWGGGQTHVWEITQRLVRKYSYSIDIFTRALKDNKKSYTTKTVFHKGKLRLFRVGPTTSFFNIFLTLGKTNLLGFAKPKRQHRGARPKATLTC